MPTLKLAIKAVEPAAGVLIMSNVLSKMASASAFPTAGAPQLLEVRQDRSPSLFNHGPILIQRSLPSAPDLTDPKALEADLNRRLGCLGSVKVQRGADHYDVRDAYPFALAAEISCPLTITLEAHHGSRPLRLVVGDNPGPANYLDLLKNVPPGCALEGAPCIGKTTLLHTISRTERCDLLDLSEMWQNVPSLCRNNSTGGTALYNAVRNSRVDLNHAWRDRSQWMAAEVADIIRHGQGMLHAGQGAWHLVRACERVLVVGFDPEAPVEVYETCVKRETEIAGIRAGIDAGVANTNRAGYWAYKHDWAAVTALLAFFYEIPYAPYNWKENKEWYLPANLDTRFVYNLAPIYDRPLWTPAAIREFNLHRLEMGDWETPLPNEYHNAENPSIFNFARHNSLPDADVSIPRGHCSCNNVPSEDFCHCPDHAALGLTCGRRDVPPGGFKGVVQTDL
jgi:hypothetical protein